MNPFPIVTLLIFIAARLVVDGVWQVLTTPKYWPAAGLVLVALLLVV